MSDAWIIALPLWALFIAIVVGGVIYSMTTAKVWDQTDDQPDPKPPIDKDRQ